MDSKELEDKLERDNVTLKEHIMKLQNTIKQIKNEMINNDDSVSFKKNEKTTPRKNKLEILNNYHNPKYSYTKDSDKEAQNDNEHRPKEKIKTKTSDMSLKQKFREEDKYYDDDDETSLKFSFNKKNIVGKEVKPKSEINELVERKVITKVKDKEGMMKKNVYQDNLAKIRKEKELITQMESIKVKTNCPRREDSDEEEEEDENKEERERGEFKYNNMLRESDDMDMMSKCKKNAHDLQLEDLNPEDKKQNQQTNLSYHSYNSNSNNTKKKVLNEDLSHLLLEKKANKMRIKNEHAIDFDDKSDNSFEEKVKNLERLKKPEKATSRTPSQQKILKNYPTHHSTKHKEAQTLPNSLKKGITKKINTLKRPSSGFPVQTPSSPKGSSNHGSLSVYQAEINQLKKEIAKLKHENDKLKESLQGEKIKNAKFQEITQELIKYYEYVI